MTLAPYFPMFKILLENKIYIHNGAVGRKCGHLTLIVPDFAVRPCLWTGWQHIDTDSGKTPSVSYILMLPSS